MKNDHWKIIPATDGEADAVHLVDGSGKVLFEHVVEPLARRLMGAHNATLEVRDQLMKPLDQLYIEFRETERAAIWGGSFEREHSAQQHIRRVAAKMFEELLTRLEQRKIGKE